MGPEGGFKWDLRVVLNGTCVGPENSFCVYVCV